MPSSSRARCGGRRPQVVGMGDLADACGRRARRRATASMSASDWLASTIGESSRRTSAIPVGAEWNACWKRRRACSSARTALLALGDVAQPHDHAGRRSGAGGRPSPRRASRVARRRAAGANVDRTRRSTPARPPRQPARRASVPRVGVDELDERPADERRSTRRPVSSAALALAPRTTPSASSDITASGRSSSSRRSSASVSMSRSIVRLRWRVMRRDSSHVTTTAATASDGDDDGGGDGAGRAVARRDAHEHDEPTSSTAATTTERPTATSPRAAGSRPSVTSPPRRTHRSADRSATAVG